MWFTPGHLYNVYAKLWSMVCIAILDKFYIDQSSDRCMYKWKGNYFYQYSSRNLFELNNER